MMKDLSIMLVQADLVWENPDRNRLVLGSLIHKGGEADLILLPETFSTGFTMNASAFAEAPGGETEEWMRDMAEETGACIAGSYIVQEDGNYYNRFLAVTKKGIIAQYDKRHLFRMGSEHEIFTAGKKAVVFTLHGWRICPMICYDLRFPVWSRNRLKSNSVPAYDLLLYTANWPFPRAPHWKLLLQARAVENLAYVAATNRVGVDGKGVYHSGDSCIFNFQGTQLSSAVHMETIVKKTISGDALLEYRERFPAWMDSDGFAVAL